MALIVDATLCRSIREPFYVPDNIAKSTVGWCIIVMVISLALVVGLWLWIGHLGQSYSANLNLILVFHFPSLLLRRV